MKELSIINNILAQAKQLDCETRLFLMEELARLIRISRKEASSQPTKLLDLNSLGSEIWKGVDLDKYVQQQRQWN